MHSKLWRVIRGGLILGVAGFLITVLWGCCGKYTKRDRGRSVTHNIAAQLVNPEAGQEVYVSRGQTPEAAVNAYDKYNKSFKKEEQGSLMQMMTTGGGGGGY